MAKIITEEELGNLVKQLLLNPETLGQDFTPEVFAAFMGEIAQVVCDHCGGEVGTVMPPEFLEGFTPRWTVGIHGNDSLPDDGGVWKALDLDGEL